MYVCGITPYDATHIGHAATYVLFDTIHRFWLATGRTVQYVQNVTDVDDPLLERAARDGVDWRQLAEFEIQRFRDDMVALRVLPPTHLVGAVETVDLAAQRVAELRDAGAAYLVDEDLYFSVSSAARFGSVSHLSDPDMLEKSRARGGDPQRAGKRNPLDPLLWQAPRVGEPSWDSELGPGRPGWHIECASIALDLLGPGFDVQGGGRDLVFPHHEMSAAEGEVLEGWPFARAYVHAPMVSYEGAKMSKSLGNLVFVSRLREAGANPWRSGWRSWPSPTGRTGRGQRSCSTRPPPGCSAGEPRCRGRPGPMRVEPSIELVRGSRRRPRHRSSTHDRRRLGQGTGTARR